MMNCPQVDPRMCGNLDCPYQVGSRARLLVGAAGLRKETEWTGAAVTHWMPLPEPPGVR